MKKCNACLIEKPTAEFSPNGGGALRPQCKECRKAALVAWRSVNPDKSRAGAKRWAADNKEKRRAIEIRYRAANPQKTQGWSNKYRRANLGKNAALAAGRRNAKSMRTPPWSDLAAIEAIYRDCERISAETGIPHHVDHDVPLRGKLVSGLHVPLNLKIIPAAENLKKKNKFTVA